MIGDLPTSYYLCCSSKNDGDIQVAPYLPISQKQNLALQKVCGMSGKLKVSL